MWKHKEDSSVNPIKEVTSVPTVKGGLDQRGGEKLDHSWMAGGFDLVDRQGGLERRPVPQASRGAFRPERKAPRPIAATWRAGLSVDM